MVERIEKAFRRARDIYEENGRRIFNATIGGKLEVFDRVNYYSLFKRRPKALDYVIDI
jgi:hypothetical protein